MFFLLDDVILLCSYVYILPSLLLLGCVERHHWWPHKAAGTSRTLVCILCTLCKANWDQETCCSWSQCAINCTVGLLKERNAEVGQLMGEKAALEREIEKLKEEVYRWRMMVATGRRVAGYGILMQSWFVLWPAEPRVAEPGWWSSGWPGRQGKGPGQDRVSWN